MNYGKIHGSFWTDPKIRGYSDDGKLLAAYLLSSPHRNLIGCYRLPIGYICDDLGWQADRVAVALTELASGERPFIVRDAQGWTHIVNFLRYDPIGHANHFKAARRFVETVPRDSVVFQSVGQKLAASWKSSFVPLPDCIHCFSRDLLGPPQALDSPSASPTEALRRPERDFIPAPAPAPAPAPKKDDAKASGVSPRAMLFNSCLTWLAELNGKDPDKYRSIIGQWLRDHGEIRTLQIFVEAQKTNPQGDRVAYMAQMLKPKVRKAPQI